MAAEQKIIYDEMKAETGFTIRYSPLEDETFEVCAVGEGSPDMCASFSAHRIDEAHILYTESTELLRSRAKLGQSHDEIRRAEKVLFALFRGEKVSPETIASVSAPRVKLPVGEPVSKRIDVGGELHDRLLVQTRLITLQDKDLLPVIEEFAGKYLKPGDTLYVSEKALTITQGRIIDLSAIKPGWFARLFARSVNTFYGTADFRGFGHGTPLAMQLLIEEAGYPRALFAAAISVITRPFGIRGAFYYLCGKLAKSIDLPMSFLILEYAHAAKLAPRDPDGEARRFKAKLGCEVVILDANYRGAISLGKSTRAISEQFIGKLFRDNPMGQSDEMTPFCIVRSASR